MTIAGVLAAFAIPGPLVPAVEGVLLLGLLAWGQLEFQSRRKDSPAYREHVTDIQEFARSARDSGLFMTYATGGKAQVVNPISMAGARARDFRSHYSKVANAIDKWNSVATGYGNSAMRYQGLTNIEAEKATDDRSTQLPMLLSALGRGDVDIRDVWWRAENINRLEAAWQLDIYNQPAFSPMITTGLTWTRIDRLWAVVSEFPNLADVRDWRTKVDEERRLRPVLLDGLEQAEIGVRLKGNCEHCPP
ncbi:MAG TPA: hypothetical protein VGU71_21670 [Candidatus Dormibacteraeota bacterium]|nr:hypothetical protein [Candidatus Dormibacteraeota bacterium]